MSRKTSSYSLIFGFFFGSGFAALLYQVVWLKYLNLLFGSTTYATAAVLSGFMTGLSLGSWLSPRLPSLYKNPLRSYGLVEICVGLFAMIFPWIYSAATTPFAFAFNLLGPQTFWYNLVVFFVTFLVLLVPTSLMGATLPLLSHFVIHDDKIAKQAGMLYAFNTTGAVVGIILTAFVLIPTFGLRSTIYVGVVINLSVGLISYLLGKPEDIETAAITKASPRNSLLYLYAISGLLALGYEVLWTRILVLHLGSSVYAYAIMLSIFLLGISVGSFVSGRWIGKRAFPSRESFAWIQILWAFSILLQILQFGHLSNVLFSLASQFHELTAGRQFVILFVGALQVLILPTFLSGALFPVVVNGIWSEGIKVEKAISSAYTYNTIGGIFGSIVAAFLLIPLVGTEVSLLIFAATNLFLGFVAGSRSIPKMALLAIVIAFCAGSFLLWKYVPVLQMAGIFRTEGGEKLLHLEEDTSATISVEKRMYFREPFISLSVNGVNVAGSSAPLVAIQKMQGNIPMMMFGPNKPKKVLHIGFGSGGTAYSVSLYPNTRITVVELSRAIVRNANASFRSENHGIVDSGKLRFIYFDGRSFLKNSKETFDVILSDSVHPRYSGNGSLYTKDYYQLVYDRLNDGGVHSQWIPTYSLSDKNLKEILRAFWEVFPDSYVWYVNSTINPYIIVTGKKAKHGISLSDVSSAFQVPEIQNDISHVAAPNEYFILDYFLFGPKGMSRYVANVDPHTDDRMTVEYESSRILNKQASWRINHIELIEQREPINAYLTDASGLDAGLLEQFYQATTANLQGQTLFLQDKRKEAKLLFQEAFRINPRDQDPYEYSKIGF